MEISKREYNSILEIIKEMLFLKYEWIDKDTIQFYYDKQIELEDGTYSNTGDKYFIPELKAKLRFVLKDKIKFSNK